MEFFKIKVCIFIGIWVFFFWSDVDVLELSKVWVRNNFVLGFNGFIFRCISKFIFLKIFIVIIGIIWILI